MSVIEYDGIEARGMRIYRKIPDKVTRLTSRPGKREGWRTFRYAVDELIIVVEQRDQRQWYSIFAMPHNPIKEDFAGIHNQELRALIYEFLGFDEIVRIFDLKVAHEDEIGKLYRYDGTGDDHDQSFTIVAVKNSTPEPDGSYKDYYLKTPPEMKRAKQAVAWTFGMTEDQYVPVVQT